MTTLPIRVATADPQPIFRAGIRQILAAFPDIVVVGEAASSTDAFTLCERVRVDLLLIDAAMPGALTLIGQLRERRGTTRAVILTEHVDPVALGRALQLGIGGYLLKDIDAFDLAQALRSAAGGFLTLASAVSAVAIEGAGLPEPDPDELSDREQSVLELLLHGLSNRAIAARLNLSCATIKFHLRNIYDKLGVRTRAEAMALFYRQQQAAEPLHAHAHRPFDRRSVAVAS